MLVVRRLPRLMAQALPSFVELLASLDPGVESQSETAQHYALYPTSPSFPPSPPSSPPSLSNPSRSSSGSFFTSPASASGNVFPSPSIVISHPSPTHESTHHGVRRKGLSSNRFNPYGSVNAIMRRRSLPGNINHEPDHSVDQLTRPCRVSSASPPRRLSGGDTERSDVKLRFPTRLSITRITMSKEDQPISSLVRRRQPSSSPNSPVVSHANRRSSSPNTLSPVTIPSLPPLPRISAEGGHSPAAHALNLPPISHLDLSLDTHFQNTSAHPFRSAVGTSESNHCRSMTTVAII